MTHLTPRAALALALVAAAATVAGAEPFNKSAGGDKTGPTLMELRTAAQCDDPASPWRVWCIAADYPNGKVGTLPKKNLVGLSIELVFGADARREMTDAVSLSALAISGDKVKVTYLTPSNKSEEPAIASAVASVAILFKHKSTVAELSPDLARYVTSLAPKYATTTGAAERTWTGTMWSTMRQVGDSWVVIEHSEGGITVTLLTDRWK